jgi:hypothetical protein
MKRQALALIWLLNAPLGFAAEAPTAAKTTTWVQAWLGGLDTNDSWKVTDADSGERILGDLGTLPFGGGAGQTLWGSGAWKIGYEGGALVSWKNDSTTFRGTNNFVQVQVDNTFFSLGVFMGGVVSVNASRWVRLYAAAGPSLTWAWLSDNDNNDTPPPPSGNNVIYLNGTNNAGSLVPYARAGLEFVLEKGFTFGASVRYANDEFDFDDAGKLKFDEALWLLTLGSRL